VSCGPPGGFELPRRQTFEKRELGGEKIRRDRWLHVRGDGLDGLLAELGEMSLLVGHPAQLPTHREGAMVSPWHAEATRSVE